MFLSVSSVSVYTLFGLLLYLELFCIDRIRLDHVLSAWRTLTVWNLCVSKEKNLE